MTHPYATQLHVFTLDWLRYPPGLEVGSLLLRPDYQRGVVWGRTRQLALVQSLWCELPIPAVVLNNRAEAADRYPDCDFDPEATPDLAIIDGLQRLTAFANLLTDRLQVPLGWFDDTAGDQVTLPLSQLPKAAQRKLSNRPLSVGITVVPTIADEQAIYRLLNYGGLPQGQQDDDLVHGGFAFRTHASTAIPG